MTRYENIYVAWLKETPQIRDSSNAGPIYNPTEEKLVTDGERMRTEEA